MFLGNRQNRQLKQKNDIFKKSCQNLVWFSSAMYSSCSRSVTIPTKQIENKAIIHLIPTLIKLWPSDWAVHFCNKNPSRGNSAIRNFRLWTCNTTQGAEDSLITQGKEFPMNTLTQANETEADVLRRRLSLSQHWSQDGMHLWPTGHTVQCVTYLNHLLSN